MSDIQFYLEYLVECGLEIDDIDLLVHDFSLFRKVRNDFAHGNWAALEEDLEKIYLRDAFSAVSDMLEAVESAAWRRDGRA